MNSVFRSLVGLMISCLLGGCGNVREESVEPPVAKPLLIHAVNYPLCYFAERVGGELVEVRLPVPPEEDPAHWRPGPEDIAMVQQADLILLNGAGYAGWIQNVSLPLSRVVDTSRSFSDKLISLESDTTHKHGPEGEHAHGTLAFTVWLDPALALEQARAIKDALSARLPDSTLEFAERFAALERELLAMDKQIENIISSDPDKALLFSHPVYQYFERRYGINGMSVHWEPRESPTEAMWTDLRELLARHPGRWMVWEGTPETVIVDQLRKLGLNSAVFEPCENVPNEGDFLSVMESNVQELKRVFETK